MTGELVHVITERTRKDGTLVDVELFGAPVIVGGEAVGLYGMYHDISELQRARAKRRRRRRPRARSSRR